MKTFKICRLFNCDVFVDFSFLIAFTLLSLFSLNNGLIFLMMFGIVLAHEYGHVIKAKSAGIGCHKILLSVLGGMAMLNNVAQTAKDEWEIAVAGIRVNLYLIIAGLVVMLIANEFNYEDKYNLLTAFMQINFMLVIFNLLPAYPMDGGRILKAALWRFMPLERAMPIVNKVARILFVLVAGTFCYFGNYLGMFMMIFMLGINYLEVWANKGNLNEC